MSVDEAMARFERMAFLIPQSACGAGQPRTGGAAFFQEDNANQGGVLHGVATASLIHGRTLAA
jgi:hypothetical protein